MEKEFEKLQTFESSLFIGQKYFNNDGGQLYLPFQLLYYTLLILKKLHHRNLEVC